MGLLAVPGAALAQRAHQLGEAHQLGPHRGGQLGDPQRGQVVGLEAAVEVGPVELDHHLVGQSQALEDDDRRRWVVGGQLDRREHGARVALGDQEGPALPRGLGGEAMPVDQADSGGQGIHSQAGPGQVEERQGGHQLDLDPLVGDQQGHAALGHQRRAGDGVEHLTVLAGRLHQALDDGGVDLVERDRPVVEVVAGHGGAHDVGARVGHGAQVAHGNALEGGEGGGAEQVGPRRSETDDHDPRGHRPPARGSVLASAGASASPEPAVAAGPSGGTTAPGASGSSQASTHEP